MADYTPEVLVHEEKHDEHGSVGFITPDVTMLILTWATFFTVLAILTKYAWKPILAKLDERENAIRKSVEDAQRIEAELAELEATKQAILKEAREKASAIIADSRHAATEAARNIEAKAREDAKIILENASRDINAEKEKAQAELRIQSARAAVELAEKLIRENIDEEKNRRLIDSYIKDI